MYKLLIADDERVIRESISTLIDWKSLGIELIGLAKDGSDAYNMIIDECPDIVLTDIKMPGFTGIELIEKIRKINTLTQFVILSGYGEFEFAKAAMRFGVRHYLLKPCSEQQIIDAMQAVVADFERARLHDFGGKRRKIERIIYHHTFLNMLRDCLLGDCKGNRLMRILARYEHLLDLYRYPCELIFVKGIKETDSRNIFNLAMGFYGEGNELTVVYADQNIYFLVRSGDIEKIYSSLAESIRICDCFCEVCTAKFQNLSELMNAFVAEIREASRIVYYSADVIFPIDKDENLHSGIQKEMAILFDDHVGIASLQPDSIRNSLAGINDLLSAKHFTISLIISAFSRIDVISIIAATEWIEFVNHASSVDEILMVLEMVFKSLGRQRASSQRNKAISYKIRAYVMNHLADSRLSLKWIADNVLYMNEDYISRRFIKESGSKFSDFLTEMRITKAKTLLLEIEADRIADVAARVGFENNPKYFSQIFKKYTGFSPSAYRERYGRL
ncbi:hypothetical protein BEQ56_05645 [Anaerolineaceae bacterium oral taxon 439]|nr:hypothetical protein BEQ56_05645 [Anaerolineaceae bacterium oral taxon 439]